MIDDSQLCLLQSNSIVNWDGLAWSNALVIALCVSEQNNLLAIVGNSGSLPTCASSVRIDVFVAKADACVCRTRMSSLPLKIQPASMGSLESHKTGFDQRNPQRLPKLNSGAHSIPGHVYVSPVGISVKNREHHTSHVFSCRLGGASFLGDFPRTQCDNLNPRPFSFAHGSNGIVIPKGGPLIDMSWPVRPIHGSIGTGRTSVCTCPRLNARRGNC